MLKLNNITLITVDGVNPEDALKSLLISSQEIEFGNIKLISYEQPLTLPSNIEFHQIAKLTWPLYNRFILHQLYKYVDTDYCLLVQPDGFILNPSKWQDKFFEYDYIGAPWKNGVPHYRVGNGGFSFRSKKLLEFTKQLIFDGVNIGNEDGIIAHNKNNIEQNNMKYADIETAYNFSVEDKIPEKEWSRDNCFGFHRFYDYNDYKEKQTFENFLKNKNK